MTDMIAALLTRPPRHEYDESELGPDRFCMDGKLYRRENIVLENRRGHKLQCSHYYEEVTSEEEGFVRVSSPCVVYLHSLCGSRLEADEVVEGLLDKGLSLFSLDFSGSGKSEGESVSLGFYEAQDLEAVLEHLQDDPLTTSVGFWGRSVGAVVAVTVAGSSSFRNRIGGLVLDSPYSSLREMIDDLAEFYIPKVPLIPYEMVVDATVNALRDDVKVAHSLRPCYAVSRTVFAMSGITYAAFGTAFAMPGTVYAVSGTAYVRATLCPAPPTACPVLIREAVRY